MSITHIVKQGEHLPGIASKYGFANCDTLWNHPQNLEIKKTAKELQHPAARRPYLYSRQAI